MATAAQQHANKQNAKHSTGPRTTEGKLRSSRNAVKHGLRAEDPLIPGEDPDAFEEHACEIFGDLKPCHYIEEQRAALVARQHRLEEKHFTELDFFGRAGIVGRMRRKTRERFETGCVLGRRE